MASKSKAARKGQKAYWEKKLDERLSTLKEKGATSENITKDTAVRKIRAKIRDADLRLKAISEAEKKLEDMARRRTEKAAAPKKEKEKKEKESAPTEEMSKRQQKKRKKQKEKQSKQEAE